MSNKEVYYSICECDYKFVDDGINILHGYISARCSIAKMYEVRYMQDLIDKMQHMAMKANSKEQLLEKLRALEDNERVEKSKKKENRAWK